MRCRSPTTRAGFSSCTANAIAFAYQFDEIAQKNATRFLPSRRFLYYNERAIEGTVGEDCGAQIRSGIKPINSTGICTPAFNDLIPGSAADAMHIVGVVEIVAGLTVAVMPRFGGLLVAGWLGGIIVNLLIVGGYGDIALRDFGLLLGALTLARLATVPRDR